MNSVKYVCKFLHDCGVAVEDICFIGTNVIPNFEHTNGLRLIIRNGCTTFLLQHLAVWSKNVELLDWVLTCKNKDGDQTMYNLIIEQLGDEITQQHLSFLDRSVPKDLTVKTYIRAHLSPVRVKTLILNEALMMNDVELVKILVERYLCNPFGPWEYRYSNPLQYAFLQSMNV